MGLFTRRNEPRYEQRSFDNDWMTRVFPRGMTDNSGPVVNEHSALTLSVVYRCVDLIADTVSTFPMHRYREDAKGRAVKQKNDPKWMKSPSTDIDLINWKRLVVVGWLLRGYSAGLVTGSRNGVPTGIELIHPDRVSFHRIRKDAPLQYAVDGKEMKRWPRGPLWIADGKMMSPSDPTGRSVLEFAAADMGLGLSARKFGKDFFDGGGHPTAMLKNPNGLKDGPQGTAEDAANRVKERFMRAVNGSREPVVMTDGWEYVAIQIAPEESQFLLTINANRLTTATFFGVPGSMVGAAGEHGGGTIEYTNNNDKNMDFLKFTINPWVVRMEAVMQPLLTRNEFIKLNIDTLIRPDINTRYKAHEIAVRTGWKSNNEIRDLEDMEPLDDEKMDQMLWPPFRTQLSFPEMENDPDNPDNTDDPRWNEDAPPAVTTAPGPKGKSKKAAENKDDGDDQEAEPEVDNKSKRFVILRDDSGRPSEVVID